MKEYLPRTWVSPKLVHGESRIHYHGVFTTAPVARGEKLMEFGGQPISQAEADEGPYRVRSIWIVADGVYLALPESDKAPSLDENLNHSCDANAWLSDEVTLIARRDIAAGEEITMDQGTWNFDETEYTVDAEDCTCGSNICRRRLTEADWQLPAVQVQYKDHFHPIVQAMIEAARPGRRAQTTR
jgi:hypothetical protein